MRNTVKDPTTATVDISSSLKEKKKSGTLSSSSSLSSVSSLVLDGGQKVDGKDVSMTLKIEDESNTFIYSRANITRSDELAFSHSIEAITPNGKAFRATTMCIEKLLAKIFGKIPTMNGAEIPNWTSKVVLQFGAHDVESLFLHVQRAKHHRREEQTSTFARRWCAQRVVRDLVRMHAR